MSSASCSGSVPMGGAGRTARGGVGKRSSLHGL